MSDLPARALSLHRLERLPLDARDPIYAHYTLLKLGVEASVLHYAKQLVPLVERAIQADPDRSDWILTSPAFHVVPSAANLLCRTVFELLADRLPPPTRAALVEIPLARDPAAAGSLEYTRRDDYSQLDRRERLRSRAHSDRLMLADRVFAGRAVLFVNDINVTGAQRRGMHRYFERMHAASVTWLCIIDVAPAIGRREPQVERSINDTSPLSVDDFASVLAAPGIRCTSRCLTRLFGYGATELARILGALGADRRAEILRLAVAEGRYDGDACAEQMRLLVASQA